GSSWPRSAQIPILNQSAATPPRSAAFSSRTANSVLASARHTQNHPRWIVAAIGGVGRHEAVDVVELSERAGLPGATIRIEEVIAAATGDRSHRVVSAADVVRAVDRAHPQCGTRRPQSLNTLDAQPRILAKAGVELLGR